MGNVCGKCCGDSTKNEDTAESNERSPLLGGGGGGGGGGDAAPPIVAPPKATIPPQGSYSLGDGHRHPLQGSDDETGGSSRLTPGSAPVGRRSQRSGGDGGSPGTTPPDVVVIQPGGSRQASGRQGRSQAGSSSQTAKSKQRFLKANERQQLQIKLVDVPEVDQLLQPIQELYNPVIGNLNELRTVHDELVEKSPEKPKTLDKTMQHIGSQLNPDSKVKVWRNSDGKLLCEYHESNIESEELRADLRKVSRALMLISLLEPHRDPDVGDMMAQAGNVSSKKAELEMAVFKAKHGEKGPENMANCKFAIEQIQQVTTRWIMINNEIKVLVHTFLSALKHIMSEPVDLTLPEGTQAGHIGIMVKGVSEQTAGEALLTWLDRDKAQPKARTSSTDRFPLDSSSEGPTTEEQRVTTEASIELPKDTIKEPKVTTEEPKDTTEEPKVTTEEPKDTTEEPKDTTEEPKGTTEEPKVQTEEPKVQTEEPKSTTEELKVTVQEPKDTTEDTVEESKDKPEEKLDSSEAQKEVKEDTKEETEASKDKPEEGENPIKPESPKQKPEIPAITSETSESPKPKSEEPKEQDDTSEDQKDADTEDRKDDDSEPSKPLSPSKHGKDVDEEETENAESDPEALKKEEEKEEDTDVDREADPQEQKYEADEEQCD